MAAVRTARAALHALWPANPTAGQENLRGDAGAMVRGAGAGMCRLLAMAITGLASLALGLWTPNAIRDTPWSTGVIGALGILWFATALAVNPRRWGTSCAGKTTSTRTIRKPKTRNCGGRKH
jgi:hypothetical protein